MRKRTKRLFRPEFQIFPVNNGQNYYWRVQKKADKAPENFADIGSPLTFGEASSFEQALRNARNFIRHNQNLVYA